jgi:DGQHR domain-containing protein
MTFNQVSYISVTQPIGTFYLTSIKASILLSIADILSRDMTEEGQQRVQREYNEKRGKEIASYTCEHNATFPTSIILAAYPDCVRVDEMVGKLSLGRLLDNSNNKNSEEIWEPLKKDALFKIGEIIDGQHRLLGMKRAIEELECDGLQDFELPVALMLDLDQSDKAYIFSTINHNQRSVSSSLIMDLFGLQEGRSPQKTCHEIAQAFYNWPDGPFERGLKMLGKKTSSGEMLSQGSFAKYVLPLISRTPNEDAKILGNYKVGKLAPDTRCPLRQFFIDEKDNAIGSILNEYFSAVRDKFEEEWKVKPEEYLLRKTVGFSALIKIFIAIWDQNKIKDRKSAAEYFQKQAALFKDNLDSKKLTSNYFPSSEKGARMMADALLGIKAK